MTHFKAFLTSYLEPYNGRVLLIGAADHSNPTLRVDEHLVSFPRESFPIANRLLTQLAASDLSAFLRSTEECASSQLDVAKSVFELKLSEQHPIYYRDYYLSSRRTGLEIDAEGLKRLQVESENRRHFQWIASHTRVKALSQALNDALKLPKLYSESEPYDKE